MNILLINIRVGGNLVKRKRIAHLIRAGKVNICFIQESKLSSLDLNVVSSLWGDVNVEWSESGAVGTTWGFSILWRKDLLKLSFSFRGEGFVGVNAEWMGQDLFFVNVYSPCQLSLKRRLWRDLIVMKNKFSRGIG